MRHVDFYKLSRPVQDQFVASARSTGVPGPLLKTPATTKKQLVWLGISGGAAAALALVYVIGFGTLGNPLAIHGTPLVAIYVALGFVIAFGILKAASHRRAIRALPYPAGIYVFPANLVDATAAKLKVFAMSDLVSSEPVAGPEPRFVLAFPGSAKFAFPIADLDQASALQRAFATAKSQLERALSTHDPRAMAALDPLYDSAFSSPIGPTAPLEANEPIWSRVPWGVAAAFALMAGPAIFWLRNVQSDNRLFASVSEANTVSAFHAYLDQGVHHRTVIEETLLPRAELREAEKPGTVEAIEKYQAEHPRTWIDGEVKASLRTALLAELEQAKKAGTLAALRDFVKRHPGNGLDAEIKTANHAVYVAALEAYRAHASEKDPAVVPFVERLLAAAEKSGPRVEVRFRRKVSKSLARADAAVSKSKMFQGVTSLPSRFLDEKHDAVREQALVASLAARFAEIFPTEILSLQPGELIADPEAPFPPVTASTFFVEHGFEWSGTLYPSKAPRGVFAGLIYSFDGSFRLADASVKPLRIKAEAWRPADLTTFKDEASADPPVKAKSADDTPEAHVYETMAKDAYEQYAKKAGGTFFKTVKQENAGKAKSGSR